MRAYLCGKKISAARCARKVIGNPKLNRSMDKTRSPRAGHQSHELNRRVGSCHWRLSLAGPLYHQIAVAVAAVPKMPHLCQLETWFGGPAAQVRCWKADIRISNPQWCEQKGWCRMNRTLARPPTEGFKSLPVIEQFGR